MIIGVTGPLCAGTDTFGEILRKEKGFIWFSYSDILREELKKRNVEITRKNLQDIGDELRKKEGLGVLSKIIIEKIDNGFNYVIGNIRNPGEVEILREKFGKDFVLVRIDADVELRFERLSKRRREKDPKTWDEFRKVEDRDFGINEKNYGQQHVTVFAMANFVIENNGSFDELKQRVEELLRKIS